jgi:hypothetical protein
MKLLVVLALAAMAVAEPDSDAHLYNGFYRPSVYSYPSYAYGSYYGNYYNARPYGYRHFFKRDADDSDSEDAKAEEPKVVPFAYSAMPYTYSALPYTAYSGFPHAYTYPVASNAYTYTYPAVSQAAVVPTVAHNVVPTTYAFQQPLVYKTVEPVPRYHAKVGETEHKVYRRSADADADDAGGYGYRYPNYYGGFYNPFYNNYRPYGRFF